MAKRNGVPTADEAPEWLRLADAVRILDASETTVRRWAQAGHIRFIRTPGGQRRFRREDVERIARQGVIESGAA